MFDLLIIGGGPAAISCGLVLGSAAEKPYMKDKKIGIIAYTKGGDLNAALLNNLFGVPSGTKGKELIKDELERLKTFTSIEQLTAEAITAVAKTDKGYKVSTATNTYETADLVLAIGHHPKIADIKGLEDLVVEHSKSLPGVNKSALKNNNLLVKDGLYAAGLTADGASQSAISVGLGADVAVQLLTKWNDGVFDHHHDK